MKHFLALKDVSGDELRDLIQLGAELKDLRGTSAHPRPLTGQTWAMIFNKSSTRTRVSFEVGVRELGGDVMMLSARDLQLGRGEPIKDTARVLGRMVHGAIIRTFAQQDVVDFAHYAKVPTVNALTDGEHPCQVVADLLTIQEHAGGWEGKKIVYLGDGANNMAYSWIWASVKLGFQLVISSPLGEQPDLQNLGVSSDSPVSIEPDPKAAVREADVLYTDVWVSMGQEDAGETREQKMAPYQVNRALVEATGKVPLVLHCLPAYRGKEIDEETLEANATEIFDQAENRLHAQKAILLRLAEA
ncbi:MAG: ornithine carbamoyltransferase [Verrucomicrobiota bacterium]